MNEKVLIAFSKGKKDVFWASHFFPISILGESLVGYDMRCFLGVHFFSPVHFLKQAKKLHPEAS